jgi:Cytochrome B561
MLISGPLMVWSNGYSINIFGLVTLPSPMDKNKAIREVFETAHKLGANILLYSFLLHMGGVAKHLLIDRDNILRRMLKPGNH